MCICKVGQSIVAIDDPVTCVDRLLWVGGYLRDYDFVERLCPVIVADVLRVFLGVIFNTVSNLQLGEQRRTKGVHRSLDYCQG